MSKRLKKTIFSMILIFAPLHLLILAYLALTTGNLTFINIFSILDLQEFFPGIEKGVNSDLASLVIVASIFVFLYTKSKKS